MSQTFSLQGKLGLDARDFKKGAQQASDAIEDVADELDDLPDAGKKAGSETGSLLSSGMTKAFAAAGGAALIAKGLNDAMDVEAGLKRVEAQFALTADEAEHYGELGGDLYADAWGDSVTDATTSIAKVGQQLQEVGDIADDEMAGITSSVMAVADVFQQDFDAVLRSTGQLVRNELAEDAEEALDMITVAFQQGGDRAGDLLDTIDEYSQHWARLGIDGQEALGLIVEGFQQGFRDGDKLADLFKEFGIRALEDRAVAAFDAIGLAGQATQDAIAAGGESARGALDDVIRGLRNIEDPIERNRIATELFGTQYEDLGPQVLDVLGSIEQGLGDVEGAANDMAETVSDTTQATLEELKREAERILAEIAGDALPLIQGLLDLKATTSGEESGKGWLESFGSVISGIGDLPVLDDVAGALDGIWQKGIWGDASEDIRDVTVDTGYWTDILHDARDAAGTIPPKIEDIGDEANDTEEDVRGIDQAFQDLRDEISDRSAYFDVKDAFDDVARAAEEAADTAGKSFDEQDADARAHQRELDNLRLAVMAYDEEMGGLPDEVVSDILADIDNGSLWDAEIKLGMLARRRTMYIDVRTVGGFDPGVSGPGGTSLRAHGNDALGGQQSRGLPYLVGERGPEIFVPHTNGYLLPNTGSVAATTIANTTQRAMINLTVHSLDAQNAGRVIVDTLEEFYASGGRPL